jgi:hypothetical protein
MCARPSSCGPCRHLVAPAAVMLPRPPSCGPCRHHAAPAAVQRSFRDIKPLQPLQLGFSYLFLAACRHHVCPAAILRPLPPSCVPGRHHAAPAAIMCARPPSCGPCRHLVAPAAVMRPLQPLQLACSSAGVQLSFRWVPCHHHAAPAAIKQPPAAIMRPLPPSCGPCRHHAAPAAIVRPPAAIMRPLLPRFELPCLVRCGQVWGGPEFTAVSSCKSSYVLGEIRQRPPEAWLYLDSTCSVHLSHVLPLHWNKPASSFCVR